MIFNTVIAINVLFLFIIQTGTESPVIASEQEQCITWQGKLFGQDGEPLLERIFYISRSTGGRFPQRRTVTSGQTDKTGAFKIEGLKPGIYMIHISECDSNSCEWYQDVIIDNAKEINQSIRIWPLTSSLKGFVRKHDSNEIMKSGTIFLKDSSLHMKSYTTKMNEDGSFLIEKIPKGAYNLGFVGYGNKGMFVRNIRNIAVDMNESVNLESVDAYPGSYVVIQSEFYPGTPIYLDINRTDDEKSVLSEVTHFYFTPIPLEFGSYEAHFKNNDLGELNIPFQVGANDKISLKIKDGDFKK